MLSTRPNLLACTSRLHCFAPPIRNSLRLLLAAAVCACAPRGAIVAAQAVDATADAAGGGPTSPTAAAGPIVQPLTAIARDPNLHAWADAAAMDLYQHYYIANNTRFTVGWGDAQATDVLVDAVRRSDGVRFLPLLRQVLAQFDSTQYSPYVPMYADDHAWMGLAMCRMATLLQRMPQQTGVDAALRAALVEWTKVQSLEDLQGDVSYGMWWNSAREVKNSATNGASATLGCLLYGLQGEPQMLAFAQRVYSYWRGVALDANSGQVIDSVSGDGTISAEQFTYNYGTMIAASLCLHEATGISTYRDDAVLMGQYLVARFALSAGSDQVLNEPVCVDLCTGDLSLFKGIGARSLTQLAAHQPDDATLQALLNGSAHTLATTSLAAPGRQLSGQWSQQASSEDAQGGQTSGAMLFNVLADSAIGQSRPQTLPTLYEAEEANLTGLGTVRADGGPYTGWGYVPFAADANASVQFAISTAVQLPVQVTWRYAASAGAASRQLAAGTGGALATLKFAKTPASGALGEVSHILPAAPPGPQTLTLTVAPGMNVAAQGNMALDSLTLTYLPTAAATSGVAAGVDPACPQSPVDGSGVCGAAHFVWTPVEAATTYWLIVDGTQCANTVQPSADLAQPALLPGPHVWYVLAARDDGIVAGPLASFRYAPAQVTQAQNVVLADTPNGLQVSWDAPASTVDALAMVSVQGSVRCSLLRATRCTIPNLLVSQLQPGQVVVRLQNVCGSIDQTAP